MGLCHRLSLTIPPLHIVTDDAVLARPGFTHVAREVIAAGGAGIALHLRGPGAAGRAMHDLASTLVPLARAVGGWLLVNDRVDVALAAGADGVQLGARSLSPGDARRLVGPDRMIGVSVHSPGEAEAAARDGADFLLVGTVYETESHPGRAGSGPALIEALGRVGLATFAIGGVTPERVGEVAGAGADGIAVLRGIWDSPDPARAVAEYLDAWSRASHHREQR